MKKFSKKLLPIFFLFCIFFSNYSNSLAQRKNPVFMTGERLTYKVKFGFVKLGTIVFETGSYIGNSHINARMKFWTAQVPFLDAKTTVDDIIDTTGICVMHFEEHGRDGKKKSNLQFTYDPTARTI